MKRLFFLTLLFFGGTWLQAQSQPDENTLQIKVSTGKTLSHISDLFWGTNSLFWIEDDAALSDGKIESALKSLPCTVLRYPGGTVADNYHWEKNLLDNNAMFPYEEGSAECDFDEFMSFCTRIGAEPLLVVNTQSWYLKGDIEGGAKEAAAWVRYCKKKGYKVRYYEIGNETYWHTVMTAKEYGALSKTYAERMKAEDPDIILSVNGGWDVNMTGNKERTDSTLWEELRKGYLSLETVKEYKAFKEKTDSLVKKPWTTGENKWWHDLITSCGDDIDMISVHWYYHDGIIEQIDKKLIELKSYLKQMNPDKDYMLCLSEYNCNTREPGLRISGFAESIGRFLNAGIDLACFWPLRIGGARTPDKSRSMLDLDNKTIQYPWQILNILQRELKGDMVACDSPEKAFTFASSDGTNFTAVVSGRQLENNSQVSLILDAKLSEIEVMEYNSDIKTAKVVFSSGKWSINKNVININVPAQGFTIITAQIIK